MGTLTCCVALRAVQRVLTPDTLTSLGYDISKPLTPILWFSTNWHDAVFAFPIISVAYLCHFNVLPLHSELVQPTRPRIKVMIHWVMGLCSILYSVIGCLGYSFARTQTDGNILNNFQVMDGIMNIGRFSLGLTLCLSFPLLVLPARYQAFRLWNVLFVEPFQTIEFKKNKNSDTHLNSYTTIIPTYTNNNNMDIHQNSLNKMNDGKIQSSYGSFTEEEDDDDDLVGPGVFFKIISTTTICGLALVFACAVPTVATIWSVMGSTVSIIVAYILPAACYLKIRRNKTRNRLKFWVWTLLIGGLGCLVLCTYQSMSNVVMQRVNVPAPSD